MYVDKFFLQNASALLKILHFQVDAQEIEA